MKLKDAPWRIIFLVLFPVWAEAAVNPFTWTQAQAPATNGVYYSVEAVDLNLDGYLDLIATKFKAGIEIWLGSNDGAWQMASTNLPDTGFYHQIKAVDLNLDGKQDIVAAKDNSGIEIWLNRSERPSDLKLTPLSSNLPTSESYYGLAIADLNMDKKLDIVCSSSAGVKAWLQIDLMHWKPSHTGLASYEYYHGVNVADLNLDGYPDIIAANKSQSGVNAWLGNGQGIWQPYSQGLFTAQSYYCLDLADINQDKYPEIVAANRGQQGLKIWTSNKQGRWRSLPSPTSSSGYYGVIFSDINSDGLLDIAASSNDNEGLRIWLGNGQDKWKLSSQGLPTSGYYHEIKVSDLNQDGCLELIAVGDPGIQIYTSKLSPAIILGWVGQVGYTTDGLQPEYGTTGSLFTYRLRYINLKGIPLQDGYPRVAIYKGGQIIGSFTMQQKGSKQEYLYQTSLNNQGNDYTYQFEAVDIEGNLAVGSPVYLQIGPTVSNESISRQAWAQKTIPQTSHQYYSLAVADFNSDGRLDAVIATPQGLKAWVGAPVTTSKGTESRKWLPADSGLPNEGFYYGVCLVDFNLDGCLDLFATKKEGLEAWLGDGDGRWTDVSNGLPTSGFYYGIITGDVNEDGWPDIVAGTNDQQGVKAWLGDGAGNWTASMNGLPQEGNYCSVAMLDFNQDGHLDIIAGDFNGIRLLLHDSPVKLNLLSSNTLLFNTNFQLFGLPDLLFGRFDGVTSGWAGNSKGEWLYSFTNLSVLDGI